MVRLVQEGQQLKKLSNHHVAKLFDLIEVSAEKDRDYFRFHNMMRNLLKGDHWKDLKVSARQKEKTKIVVNLAHAHVRTLLPTVFFQQPTLRAIPTERIYEAKAPTWTAVGNNTMEKIGFTQEIKEVTLDAITFPEGCFKWVLNLPPGADKADVKRQAEEGRRGPTPWLSKGAPVPVRLSPPQLVVDYLAPGRDLKQARFISIRYTKTVSELKAHPIYGPNIPKDWKPHTSGSKAAHSKKRHDPFEVWDEQGGNLRTADIDDMVTIHEVWIHQLVDDTESEGKPLRLYQQMCTLMEGYEKPIRPLTPWSELLGEGIDTFPVHRLVFNPVPDSLPTSELGVQHQLQVAINWLVSRIISIVEQDKIVREVDISKLKNPTKAKKQLASGRTMEDIEVNDLGAFAVVQPTFAGRDNYQMLNLLTQYMQQVGGFGQNRRGGSGIRTATEASLIEQGVQIKTDEKVQTMRAFLKDIVEQMLRMIRSMVANDPEGSAYVVRLAGETGQVQWKEFDQAELAWMPEIEIEIDSFRKRDQQEEVQKLMQAYGMAQQSKAAGESVRTDILLRQVFQVLGIKDIDKIIGSQQDEMLKQSMELVLISLGEPVQIGFDDDHPIHLQTIDAFRNAPVYQSLNPEVIDAIDQHAAEHEQALEQQQESSQQALGQGNNPFGSGSNGAAVPTEANIARQATAQDRIPLGVPGAGGQQEI